MQKLAAAKRVYDFCVIDTPPSLQTPTLNALAMSDLVVIPIETSMFALQVKVRHCAHVRNKVIYLAIGINFSGTKEVLGLWIQQTEGAKFWLQIVTELKNRGVQVVFIACIDGLKGFPEAIETVFPKTQV